MSSPPRSPARSSASPPRSAPSGSAPSPSRYARIAGSDAVVIVSADRSPASRATRFDEQQARIVLTASSSTRRSTSVGRPLRLRRGDLLARLRRRRRWRTAARSDRARRRCPRARTGRPSRGRRASFRRDPPFPAHPPLPASGPSRCASRWCDNRPAVQAVGRADPSSPRARSRGPPRAPRTAPRRCLRPLPSRSPPPVPKGRRLPVTPMYVPAPAEQQRRITITPPSTARPHVRCGTRPWRMLAIASFGAICQSVGSRPPLLAASWPDATAPRPWPG